MTRKQIERIASFLHELAAAVLLASTGDLVVTDSRSVLDVTGIGLGGALFYASVQLTGKLGGRRIWMK